MHTRSKLRSNKPQEMAETELPPLSQDLSSSQMSQSPTLDEEEDEDMIDSLTQPDPVIEFRRRSLTRTPSSSSTVGQPEFGNPLHQRGKVQPGSTERRISKGIEKSNLSDVSTPGSKTVPLGIILMALMLMTVVVYANFRQPDPDVIQTQFSSYEKELDNMRNKYTNQTDRFWITFLSSLEMILTTDEPDVPAVIMMAVPDDHHSMGLCFMQHLAEVLNKQFGDTNQQISLPSYIDGTKLSTLNADEQKLRIDEEIRKIVDSKQRTVIVSGLEKIDPQAILIFHGYCDNSEAVYKNIAIIFMVQVPEDSNYTMDTEIYTFLSKLWITLGPSKTKALLARMANNVAIMQKSRHFIC